MGWSCTAKAGDVMRSMEAACRRSTGMQNTWEYNGTRYFWEFPTTEHRDGRITGPVFRFLPDGYARKSGRYAINPDGSIDTMPASLRRMLTEV